tara:strand:+ start:909 stop:1550 length:642 start_codon:yes stop_codon:yes gene_type:complete
LDLLQKLRQLAIQNTFNEKQTADFINLVESGTSIDDAIDIAEKGISENKQAKEINGDIASKVEATIITIHKWIMMQTISVKGLDANSNTPRLTQMLNNGHIDDFIRGYIFGISDSAVRSLLLNKNLLSKQDAFEVIEEVYRALFKPSHHMNDDENCEQYKIEVSKALDLQTNDTFNRGRTRGGQEFVDFINNKESPNDLALYLVAGEQVFEAE